MVSLSNHDPSFDKLRTSGGFRSDPTRASSTASAGAPLSWARDRMEGAGVDAPLLSALVLLEHATAYSREVFLAHPELRLSPDQAAVFTAYVERRCRHEPLAYIVGYREFYGRRFEVTPPTLIPRPETETLVDLALQTIDRIEHREHARLLDVGTGCGAIAITLLVQRPHWTALATDTDLEALDVARRNARGQGVESKLKLVACNLVEAVKDRYPLIVANLPYIPTATVKTLPTEIARYEPRHALDGGPDGTSILAAMLQSLPAVLAPRGAALFEIGEGQAEALRAQARRSLPGCATRIECDVAGAQRFLVVERS